MNVYANDCFLDENEKIIYGEIYDFVHRKSFDFISTWWT